MDAQMLMVIIGVVALIVGFVIGYLTARGSSPKEKELKEKANRQSEEIHSLQNKVEGQKLQLHPLQQKVEEQKSQLTSLQENNQEQKLHIKQLEGQVEQMEAREEAAVRKLQGTP